jgi:hypothetical protein
MIGAAGRVCLRMAETKRRNFTEDFVSWAGKAVAGHWNRTAGSTRPPSAPALADGSRSPAPHQMALSTAPAAMARGGSTTAGGQYPWTAAHCRGVMAMPACLHAPIETEDWHRNKPPLGGVKPCRDGGSAGMPSSATSTASPWSARSPRGRCSNPDTTNRPAGDLATCHAAATIPRARHCLQSPGPQRPP